MYLHITYQHDLHIGNRKLNPYPFRNINSFFNNYNHLYWYQTIKSYSYINFLIPILSVYILIKIQTNYFLLIIKNTIGSKKFPPTNKKLLWTVNWLNLIFSGVFCFKWMFVNDLNEKMYELSGLEWLDVCFDQACSHYKRKNMWLELWLKMLVSLSYWLWLSHTIRFGFDFFIYVVLGYYHAYVSSTIR